MRREKEEEREGGRKGGRGESKNEQSYKMLYLYEVLPTGRNMSLCATGFQP